MMKITIHFTEAEMMQYLERNGYTLSFKKQDFPVIIHGSRMDWEPRTTIYAEKDGDKMEYKETFRALLTKRILEI